MSTFSVSLAPSALYAAESLREKIIDYVSEQAEVVQSKQAGETRVRKSVELGGRYSALLMVLNFLVDLKLN